MASDGPAPGNCRAEPAEEIEAGNVVEAGDVVVCNLVFLYRYMRPEGPWQRLAAAWRQRQLFRKDLFLSPIETINPSGAPLPFLP